LARTPDVVVVGGGIVGCAVAYRLALEKKQVLVLERGEIGREASWAAGGILTPIHLAEYPTPLASLCAASLRLYEPLVRELRGFSAVDPEYRVTGLMIAVCDEAGDLAARGLEDWKRANGQPVERLTRDQALERQPGLADDVRGGLFLPDIAQVRNHRMAPAFAEAAQKLGAEFRAGTVVSGFLRVPGRITGLKTSRGDVYTGTVVLAAGAWSAELARSVGLELAVRPVKGQILLAGPAPGLLRTVLLKDDRYLVPRADGRILIGSTLEDAGFDKSVTVEGLGGLARAAAALFPPVGKLPILASWAGLRPSTPDRLPYLGRTSMEGLIVAAGHFRNGILLAPVTAELVADLVAGRPPSIPLEPFNPAR
jgi:glycine oxidase